MAQCCHTARQSDLYRTHSCALQGVATFNDDIQSTGAATLAAVLGAMRLPGVPPLTQQRFLLFGAGQANIGAAQLIQHRLEQEGLSEEEAKSRLWLFDSQVLIRTFSSQSWLHLTRELSRSS